MVMVEKHFYNEEDMSNFLEGDDNKEWMYNRIYEAIEYAFCNAETEAEILAAVLEEDNTVINLTSTVDEWANSLELCMKFFVKQEEYEKCHDIKLLIEDIKTHFSDIYNV